MATKCALCEQEFDLSLSQFKQISRTQNYWEKLCDQCINEGWAPNIAYLEDFAEEVDSKLEPEDFN